MPTFNRGKKALARKRWTGVTINCALMRDTWTPDVKTQNLWGDISASEIPAVTGYTPGGVALANKSLVQNNAANKSEYEADTVAYGAGNMGRGSDPPGLGGALGVGTWAESKFDMSRYRGRSFS